jgi:hypothetical protein
MALNTCALQASFNLIKIEIILVQLGNRICKN